MYARSGQQVTFAVTTDTTTSCVVVTDAGGATIATDKSGATAVNFAITAGVGDGTKTLTFTAYKNVNNGNGTCSGTNTARTASYVLDNTGPVVTPVLTPAPVGTWSTQNTTVTWTAADPNVDAATPGSGVLAQSTVSTLYQLDGSYTLTAPAPPNAVTDRVGNAGSGGGTLNLDKSAPTITAVRTPAANGFGWNNSPVTVTFTCADNPAGGGSGIPTNSCPGASVVGSATDSSKDVTNATVTGSVSDAAGNGPSTATVSGINVDTVKPLLSGSATTPPNASGWYNSNVTVHWTASDARSGPDPATVPANSTIASEGSALTTSASVSDKAGNTTSATSAPVNIDKTPPVTGISGVSNAWTNGDVTVTLSPTDALSHVASTTYSIDGGSSRPGTSFTLTTDGDHTITFSSTDLAGNVEATRTAHVKIDKSAPTISHSFVPTYNDSTWTNATSVTVNFSCADAVSGVASCSPPVAVTAEGAGQQVVGVAQDLAGNTANNTATVSIDRSPPVVGATADRAPNGNSWYNANVSVSFTCADQPALSGVKSCPATQTFGQGGAQTATGTATDNAGNTATATVTGINVDTTAPVVTGAAHTAPNGAGWYNHSVVVDWSCSDPLSGLDGSCPAASTVTGEGTNRGATATVTDKAGNQGSGSVNGLQIDTTPPVTNASVPTPLSTGWYASSALVTLAASDNLSGPATTWYSVDGAAPVTYAGAFDFSAPGVHTITFWTRDVAGNLEDVTAPGHAITLKIDNIKPTITGTASPQPDPATGWNTSDVSVAFACADAESDVASCTGATTLTKDGDNQYVTGKATDEGGNTETTTVGPIRLDETAPVVKGEPTTSPNLLGWYNHDVRVHWSATDATSGVDTTTVPSDTIVTSEGPALTAGPVTVKDLAGNAGTGSVTGLKIDHTPPTITGQTDTVPTTIGGWYNGNVTVDWACADTGSGIADGACPAPSTITGEGQNLSVGASVSDLADNVGTTTVGGVNIDRTPPITHIDAPSSWVNTAATVTLTPTDNLSGPAATHYRINGGSEQTGTSVKFSTEGVYELTVWSVDRAGNSETPQTATVRIDMTAPSITHTLNPAANTAGWNHTSVTITFTCSDGGGSGLLSCPDPVLVTGEGKAQPFPGTASDNAGNTTTDPATVSVDVTPPTIRGTPDGPPNDNGWYNAPVRVTFSCDDQALLSGVKDCNGPVTVTEGANGSATGHATDAAGNSAATTVSGLNIDETPPTIEGEVATAPDSGLWHRGPVTVHWTCADQVGLSGLDGPCPADSTVTQEGANVSVSAQVWDKAGNPGTATVDGIHIDRTAPVTTAALRTPDSSTGWYGSAPTVTLTVNENGSGLAGTHYRIDGGAVQDYTGPFAEGLEGVHTVAFWSTDVAGNVEDAAGVNNTVTIRVDTTSPAITGSRSPAATSGIWNNTPVVVSFSCNDQDGSGLASCTDPVTLATEGQDQSVTGTAVDNVGHSGSATVGGISIDTTAPSLTGKVLTAHSVGDWYNTPVTVEWACSDGLSGIPAGTCPSPSTVGQGGNQSASATVADAAGNVTPATVGGLQIDTTPPVTSVSAPSGWVSGTVSLDVGASDNLSGVRATYYTVNGGDPQSDGVIKLIADGTYHLSFWSVDNAGNEGVHGTATVQIDKTAPTISHTITPEPNTDLWNRSDASVQFVCDDATSGVATCVGDRVVTTEGAGQAVVGTATDNAGNHSSDTATVNLDKTKPTIVGSVDRKPNGAGWYNLPVVVSFACDDNLSGPVGCPGAATVGQGAGQSVPGSVADKAGNTQGTTVSGLNVDLTQPSLNGTISTTPGAHGYYTTDVTVHWTCADQVGLSGIDGACPVDTVLTQEGSGQSATATVTDRAGNRTTTTVTDIAIDKTPPATTASAPDSTYATGWYAASVPVTLAATDSGSGVDVTYYSIDGGGANPYAAPFLVGKGVHTVTYWSRDRAGNVEDKTASGHSLTVKVDNLLPTITGTATPGPNASGWNNQPVTVHFSCADAETSVAGCTGDTTLSSETAATTVTGTATDAAGNVATASVGPVKVDLTKPTFAPYVGTTSFTLGQPMTAPTCGGRAADVLSGLASCQLMSTAGSGVTNASGVGDFTYTFTAWDKAGNSATQVVTFHVGYAWSGFLQPVTNTAHDLTTASTFKAGSTVPMKFVLRDSTGAVRQSSATPVWLAPVDLGTTATGTGVSGTDSGTVGGSYKQDSSSGQYIYTWQTPKAGTGHYYRVGVQLDSGDTYTTLIKLS
ncbi:PxKF domain-containing protein [Nostocoides sp. HKS02]|uniref:OmpL47-type beta-barrel domain-containing protein n=1 Tax=Nostocoides sp. HKS02 TaxID=1813880 RepID=UPI0012B4C6F8|nr:PxKF domain-containing protein [Tetrasphaera sp. HKS02]QGN58529.1 hypothetical protein GKE56_12240 [Tetrasphaera sp. HKS02]